MPALEAVVKSALSKSPRTMAWDFELLSARYQQMMSSSPLYPQVGAGYQYQVRDESRSEGLEPGLYDRGIYSITATQSLWHWGAVRAAAKVGELGTLIAEQNLESVRRALALEVRNSYMGLIVQKVGVRNAQFSEKLMKENLERQEVRYKAELITLSALFDIRLRTEEAILAGERAASDLEFAVRAFRQLTGVATFTVNDIPENLAAPKNESTSLEVGTATGYLKSESLLINELQIEQGRLSQKIDRKALWPKLNLMVGVSQDDNLYSTSLGERITTVSSFVGLQLQWTIFDGFASRGRRLQSKNRLLQLENARDNLIESIEDSADQQAQHVGFAWRAYLHARQRREGAAGGVAYEKDNLARGQSSEEQIANAQAALNQAELVEIDALARFYSASARYASTLQADPLIDGKIEN
ncbi:MAG TPA: TolC family protein [Opitutaceae bacterium]|nr:TolC family protein [Opitutaceae bacterium]